MKYQPAPLTAALLSTLLTPVSSIADTTFPLPGHELWGTWRVQAIEVPGMPANVAIQSLSGWSRALQISSGLLPVGQTLEFRFDGIGEPLQMALLEPVQSGVCLNKAWMFHCDLEGEATWIPPKKPIARTMLIDIEEVARHRERARYWPDLAPSGYALTFEDSAPRTLSVELSKHSRDTLYLPFGIFDNLLAKNKGLDGMVILKRIGDPPSGTPRVDAR